MDLITHILGSDTVMIAYELDLRGHAAQVAMIWPQDETLFEFEYDQGSQLATARGALSSAGQEKDVSYHYNEANRLRDDDEFEYQYDPEGRLLSKTDKQSGVTCRLAYDAEGLLRRIEETLGGMTVLFVEYSYDGLSRRTKKSTNGVEAMYVYDGDRVLMEVDGRGRLGNAYIHGPGIDDLLGVFDGINGVINGYLVDRIGSILGRVGQTGSLVARYAYDDWGVQTQGLNYGSSHPYAFGGRELDLESGLYHQRARQMDPTVGRFLSEDPIDIAGGFNLYRFAENNPINVIDPFGLSPSSNGCTPQDQAEFPDACGAPTLIQQQASDVNKVFNNIVPEIAKAVFECETSLPTKLPKDFKDFCRQVGNVAKDQFLERIKREFPGVSTYDLIECLEEKLGDIK
jgi:RHS repeat-associated protein